LQNSERRIHAGDGLPEVAAHQQLPHLPHRAVLAFDAEEKRARVEDVKERAAGKSDRAPQLLNFILSNRIPLVFPVFYFGIFGA
jgi:hypothetical protein